MFKRDEIPILRFRVTRNLGDGRKWTAVGLSDKLSGSDFTVGTEYDSSYAARDAAFGAAQNMVNLTGVKFDVRVEVLR